MSAVGVNEPADLGLLHAIDDADASRLNGSERVAAVSKGEPLEECTPGWVDGVGILLPGFKCRLDDGGVSVGRHVKGIHGR